jgi:hypothetical protein
MNNKLLVYLTYLNIYQSVSKYLAALMLFLFTNFSADDNTVSYCDYCINKVVNTLEDDSLKLINWFSINLMKAKL